MRSWRSSTAHLSGSLPSLEDYSCATIIFTPPHPHTQHTHTHTPSPPSSTPSHTTPSQVEDFGPYFSGRRKLLPRHSDLSFYNWDTNFSSSNSTPNYQVSCLYWIDITRTLSSLPISLGTPLVHNTCYVSVPIWLGGKLIWWAGELSGEGWCDGSWSCGSWSCGSWSGDLLFTLFCSAKLETLEIALPTLLPHIHTLVIQNLSYQI